MRLGDMPGPTIRWVRDVRSHRGTAIDQRRRARPCCLRPHRSVRFSKMMATIMSTRSLAGTSLGLSAIVLGVVSTSVPVRWEMAWIDPVTGSTRQQTRWVPGIQSTATVEISALERWLRQREKEVSRHWNLSQRTGVTLWGNAVSAGHSPHPPIHRLRGDPLRQFVSDSSDDVIGAFVAAMRSNSDDDQQAAVAAVLSRQTSEPRGG